MKTVMLWALLAAALTCPAQADQIGEDYAASLKAREAILDSMALTIGLVDSEELLFVTQRERTRHRHWVARIEDMVTIARAQFGRFRDKSCLYNAVCFEFAWRRLRLCWLESLSIGSDLMIYEVALMDKARSREERVAAREFTATNREVGRAFRESSNRVQQAIADVDRKYGPVCMQYLLSASLELDRVGWHP